MKEKEREELVFTGMQMEILKRLSEGPSNDTIGKELFVCRSSVKYHLNKMYQKFDLDIQDRYDKRLKLALIGKELFG